MWNSNLASVKILNVSYMDSKTCINRNDLLLQVSVVLFLLLHRWTINNPTYVKGEMNTYVTIFQIIISSRHTDFTFFT